MDILFLKISALTNFLKSYVRRQYPVFLNKIAILMALVFISPLVASAKTISVSGEICDSTTSEPVALANLHLVKADRHATSDLKGKFKIQGDTSDSIRISSLGYESKTIAVSSLSGKRNRISLHPSVTNLSEFVVKPKKQKYSKKNNPAYDLMVKIRDSKEKTDPKNQPLYSYDTYDRITLGLNDFVVEESPLPKKMWYLSDYADTAVNTGKPVLLVSVREETSTTLNSSNPRREKRIVTGKKSEGVDNAFDQENITKMLSDVLREVDIYESNIPLMQVRFISPLGDIAGDYYRYHITDTITDAGKKLIELSFAPRNPESFGFNGRMLVEDLDTAAYVKSLRMRVPRVINLNYVDNIYISQDFELDSLGKRHKVLDDMSLELQLVAGTQSFYGHRVSARSGFSYDRHPGLDGFYSRIGHDFELEEAPSRPGAFWNEMRLVPLSVAESRMGSMIGRLRKDPWFYWGEKILSILVQGYVEPVRNSPVLFGPVNTLLSFNKAEGTRLRVGAITTSALSSHWFARGYAAYGFRDCKVKYEGELEYSLIPKKRHAREFPVKSFRLSHRYDIDMLGQHYLFTNADNIFLSLKRKESYLATYQRLTKFEYKLELNNNFSIVAGLRHEIQEATPWVPFERADGTFARNLKSACLYLQLRYAPGEKFIQGRTNRSPVNLDAPIFTLTHEYGPKKVLGSDYTLNRTEFSAFKRFWLSAFGYADVLLRGGKVWSQVQYPALLWPNANLSYTIQPESYSLMNPMEFANDYYGALDLTYWVNGALFNRIPLVKKLKLREVFTFKALMGGLTKKNDPAYNPELFRFPHAASTTTLGKTPYMEIGAGIDNILTILRIDYVWRLTYRDAPDIDRSGLRISLHFSF